MMSFSNMLFHEYPEYTVAWICALPIELKAAELLLDNVHSRQPQPDSDNNIYTLGSMSGHKVVIACLPSGVYGTTSATSLVAQMRQTFPFIKFGLMVGVGGGIPINRVDIRLGDVVVSEPTETFSGVVQTDYGKVLQGSPFKRIGSLDKPPTLLLNAVSKMRSEYIVKTGIGRKVRDILHQHQAIEAFARPDDDWLFRSIYKHPKDDTDCSTCDKSQLVPRGPRESNEPHIHYGVIASGNQVIKDAQVRDSVAKRLPVLCFEMEAAGIMDQLPCLVIRGISDYCDSHKQKDWQGFASLAAAAYAKTLLLIVPPAESILTRKQVFEPTEKEKACLEHLFITDPVEDMNSLKRRKGSRTPGTCSWFLESNDFKSWLQQDKGIGCLKDSLLWLYGNPGIGKSTMAIALAEELSDCFPDGNHVLSFFFCEASSEHQREATSILRGLIYQIVKQYRPFLNRVMAKYDIRKEGLFSSFDALWSILMDIGTSTDGPDIYCIIDALDECEAGSQIMLLDQIYQSFCRQGARSVRFKLHILITSRPYPDIEGYLSTFRSVNLGACEEIKGDLKSMIQDTVKELGKRNKYTESVAQDVSRILEEKADGTFLWVGIACNELKLVQSRKVIGLLQALPRGLHSLYQSLLDATVASTTTYDQDDYPLIKKVLEFVTFAVRPLTLVELAEACRLYLDEDLSNRAQFTKEIIDLCHLLIVVDNGHVRTLHRSVQEFLLAEMKEISPTGSNYALSYRCIEIILQNCRPNMDRSTLKPKHGFLGYSVLHWAEHANLAQTKFVVPPENEQFFQNRLGAWKWWLDSYNYLRKDSWGDLGTDIPAIHVAARWGINPLISFLLQDELEDEDTYGHTPLLIAVRYSQLEAMKLLVESGACMKAVNNEHQNALHIICKKGNHNQGHDNTCRIADFLLKSGVCPYVYDKDNMTPFLYAIGNRDTRLAQIFLQNGFDMKTRIQRQSWPGRTTVSILPAWSEEKGAQENLDTNLTALHFSALNACTKTTAFLLQHGADPNAVSGTGDTALHLAIRGHLLGRKWGDVWGTGDYAIEFLRDLITDHESEEASDIYRTIDEARIQIVDTLLESEITNVNTVNTYGDYPQHVINFYEDYAWSILCKLIEKGADSLQVNGSLQTCLHLASKAGNLEVVRKLMDEGHDLLSRDIDGLSSFHYALDCGRLGVLQFMSEARNRELSRVWNSLDGHGRSPLHHVVSSVFCRIDVVEFLIQRGCDTGKPDSDGSSSLFLYVNSFHFRFDKDIFFLLVQRGADTLWVNKRRENLAHLLMQHRGADHEILKFLFECGLDPTAQDIDGRTFMHHGAIHGAFTKDLVEFLKSRPVLDIHTRDSFGKTPLNYAEEKARLEIPENSFWCFNQKWENSFNILSTVAHTLE
ncbi:Pfs, NACHT, and Ankyrin domain protein [Aspergillus affinis]|uniref:Pfs, NACHT, and Ankyrin domain protein n=1 Tax=Aspergillus affinis TaxID=1070780 RepID=UPI0022FF2AA1|nr:uncharacterized protein KD926_008240 [Aspergillus affinis]KAI9040417.1 hypothetical protein KD926_008240 [Aspergillus affinis]